MMSNKAKIVQDPGRYLFSFAIFNKIKHNSFHSYTDSTNVGPRDNSSDSNLGREE